MPSKFEIREGFAAGRSEEWRPLPLLQVRSKPQHHKELRPHQAEAFALLVLARLWALIQPTASGKSLICMATMYWYLWKHPTDLAILAVPQTSIGLGFRRDAFRLPGVDGIAVDWSPGHYLFGSSEQSKAKRLLGILRARRQQRDPLDRAIVCSHATLLRATKVAPDLFRDLLLVVDEAHHCCVEEEQVLGAQLPNGTNQLGALVHAAVEQQARNLSIGLSTATFFRGDFRGVVGPHYDRFRVSTMNYADFFDQCRWLRGLVYNFAFYRDDFAGVIDEIYQRHHHPKMIITIPAVNSGYSAGKLVDVQTVWRGVAGRDDPQVQYGDVVTRVKRGRRWFTFVDLVDDSSDREAKKQYIQQAHEGKVSLDGVVCLGMFKEGANWRQADTAVVIGQKNSLTENVQIIGRILRDHEGKSVATVYHCFREELAADHEQYQDYRLKQVLGAMMLEELFCPVVIKGHSGKKRNARTSRLLDLALDLNHAVQIRKQIIEEWVLRGPAEGALYPKETLLAAVRHVMAANAASLQPYGADDVRVIYEQTVSTLGRHRRRENQEAREIASVADLEEVLYREGMPGYFADAASLRDFRAYLLTQQANWFAQLLEQVRAYAVALGDRAYSRVRRKKLYIPVDFCASGGYPLGRVAAQVRQGRRLLDVVQKKQLLALGFDFDLLVSQATEQDIRDFFAAVNIQIRADVVKSDTWLDCCCPHGHHYRDQYATAKQKQKAGEMMCPICRREQQNRRYAACRSSSTSMA